MSDRKFWILVLLLVFLVGILFISSTYISKEGVQCISDPVTYYQYISNESCFCTGDIVHVGGYEGARVNPS